MPNLSRLSFELDGKPMGVTGISRAVFEKLGLQIEPDSNSWRKNYQSYFRRACEFEVTGEDKLTNALDAFLDLATLDGKPLHESLVAASRKKLVRIEKLGEPSRQKISRLDGKSWFSEAQQLVDQKLAEPGLLEASIKIDAGFDLSKAPILISFAGAAELAPTLSWLRWGGRVLVLARKGNPQWEELIAQAKKSGELWIPVRNDAEGELFEIAGMDLVEEPELAASAIGQIAKSEKVIFGHYGYAPGYKHIELQVVAESLTRITQQRFKSVLLSWLATPSDSVVVPKDFAIQREVDYQTRSPIRKGIDAIWKVFGYLKPPKFLELDKAEDLVVIDSSANLQGPSYSLAKRAQRWRATLEVQAGRAVAYQITPPSETDSVLSYRILGFTYKGGKHFGSQPVSAQDGSQWPAALLALMATSPVFKSVPAAYLDTAIHGGLWRTRYETETIWIPATVTGLLKFWK